MKVVALISGGKDSCYNMMQCVAAGHQIVALANLRPAENKDELDSYMYQTVGHQAVALYAEAMDLPLYRHTIVGESLDTGRDYIECEGDEVEDLYHLLKLVQEKEGVESVSVGAILSDYQRVRVENVCRRLGLQSLAYLWHRNQEDLLREMISCNIQALIIKVAAFGLDPDKHLGKTLGEMEPHLKQLSKKYGVHVCGEGGEYETFTLDCPLFKKKIVIDSMEAVVHSADAFAPVGYLRFSKMHLEDKKNSPLPASVPFGGCPCLSNIDNITDSVEDEVLEPLERISTDTYSRGPLDYGDLCSCSGRTKLGYQWICGISGVSVGHEDASVEDQTKNAFLVLQGKLEERGFHLKNIVLVHLYVKTIAYFSAVNTVYQSYFDVNPPARVCVEVPLPDEELIQIDCLLHNCEVPAEDTMFQCKQVMHIQSISHWAPANIGPYSQAVKVGEAVFCAGQIGLIPCTMHLVQGGAPTEAMLSFSHVEKVLSAKSSGLTLNHVLLANCYVTSKKNIPLVQKAWERKLKEQFGEEEAYGEEETKCGPMVVAVISRLPRDAAVELHVVACADDARQRKSFSVTRDVTPGSIECEIVESSSSSSASISLSLSLPRSPPITQAEEGPLLSGLISAFQEALQKLDGCILPLCIRAFYKRNNGVARKLVAGFGESLKHHLDQRNPAMVFVPVDDLQDLRVLQFSCWLSQ
ncbi:diphthine--ammonia ligase isoform X1 [Lepisosteus oculatus]|uniref:diphthine--ammonia ligase isoform X1 n=1 Tax=Lepisosteus oculatus TaxID=7918 RepID=UPI0037231751